MQGDAVCRPVSTGAGRGRRRWSYRSYRLRQGQQRWPAPYTAHQMAKPKAKHAVPVSAAAHQRRADQARANRDSEGWNKDRKDKRTGRTNKEPRHPRAEPISNSRPHGWAGGCRIGHALSLNPPTGLWDRRLGPVGRWAGACVRAGAFWGVRDWSAGLVRVGGAWGAAALRRALWAAQMSRGRLRIQSRAVVKVFAHGQLSGRRSLWRPLWLTRRPGTVRSRLRMVAVTVSCAVGWARPRRASSGRGCARARSRRARRRWRRTVLRGSG